MITSEELLRRQQEYSRKSERRAWQIMLARQQESRESRIISDTACLVLLVLFIAALVALFSGLGGSG